MFQRNFAPPFTFTLLLTALALLASTLAPPSALAVPRTISLQGRLSNTSGSLSGTYIFDVSIWSLESHGVVIESTDATPPQTLENGVFNISVPISETVNLSGREYWVQIIATDSGGRATTLPRQRLSSSPTALYADRAVEVNTERATGTIVSAILSGDGSAIQARSSGTQVTMTTQNLGGGGALLATGTGADPAFRAANSGTGPAIRAAKLSAGTVLTVDGAGGLSSAVTITKSGSTGSALQLNTTVGSTAPIAEFTNTVGGTPIQRFVQNRLGMATINANAVADLYALTVTQSSTGHLLRLQSGDPLADKVTVSNNGTITATNFVASGGGLTGSYVLKVGDTMTGPLQVGTYNSVSRTRDGNRDITLYGDLSVGADGEKTNGGLAQPWGIGFKGYHANHASLSFNAKTKTLRIAGSERSDGDLSGTGDTSISLGSETVDDRYGPTNLLITGRMAVNGVGLRLNTGLHATGDPAVRGTSAMDSETWGELGHDPVVGNDALAQLPGNLQPQVQSAVVIGTPVLIKNYYGAYGTSANNNFGVLGYRTSEGGVMQEQAGVYGFNSNGANGVAGWFQGNNTENSDAGGTSPKGVLYVQNTAGSDGDAITGIGAFGGEGVTGISDSGAGVSGSSASGAGVSGSSVSGPGVFGTTIAAGNFTDKFRVKIWDNAVNASSSTDIALGFFGPFTVWSVTGVQRRSDLAEWFPVDGDPISVKVLSGGNVRVTNISLNNRIVRLVIFYNF